MSTLICYIFLVDEIDKNNPAKSAPDSGNQVGDKGPASGDGEDNGASSDTPPDGDNPAGADGKTELYKYREIDEAEQKKPTPIERDRTMDRAKKTKVQTNQSRGLKDKDLAVESVDKAFKGLFGLFDMLFEAIGIKAPESEMTQDKSPDTGKKSPAPAAPAVEQSDTPEQTQKTIEQPAPAPEKKISMAKNLDIPADEMELEKQRLEQEMREKELNL